MRLGKHSKAMIALVFWFISLPAIYHSLSQAENKQKVKEDLPNRCLKGCFPSTKSVSSVTQSCLTLPPHGLQHARFPYPSPAPRACSNSCPSSQWCHPTISSSVVPFSCLQSFPTSGSFPMSQFFTPGGQSIGVSASASVLPMNIQDWFPLELTGLMSLLPQILEHKLQMRSHRIWG